LIYNVLLKLLRIFKTYLYKKRA